MLGATALGGSAGAAELTGRARIVQVEHKGATTGPTTLDEAVVERMVREAIRLHARTKTAAEGLAKIVRPGQKVLIKVNTLGSPFSAVNPVTAFTLAKVLQEVGVKKPDIRIMDQYQSRMRKAKYRLTHAPGEIWVTKHIGRDPKRQTFVEGSRRVEFHWCQSIVWADVVINVCIPKDHDLAGVTGAMKNMAFGCVSPTAERAANTADPGHYTVVPRFHRNNCDPAIPWLYSQPMIRGKVKLIVADAVRVLYHGGPQDKAGYRALHNQIMVTTDPVALDTHILELVNRYRHKRGLKPVEKDLWRGRPRVPHYIATAARMGLGVGDLARIDLDKTVLG